MPKVYITGCGPGDIELLTLKAVNAIKKADVLIYDKLININILKLANSNCHLIYVGKENKKHTIPQEKINYILYEMSLKYNNIVRLKGGDPFVFGRGSEEALFLKQKGVKFEIIPGISSAISVPAYSGIPVTHRGITSSFRVVTGHESSCTNTSQLNWESFLNDETIIFLMGYHNIEKIVNKLIAVGKDKNYPCAVISNGTTSKQIAIFGVLQDIVIKSKNLTSPVIIVIGKVVNLSKEIQWFNIKE